MIQKYTKEEKYTFDQFFENTSEPWEVEKKYIQKTIKYINYIKWIPGIKMIWIGNSIAMNSASIDSDIDLLIVSDNKRMWLVRILCTLMFQILGVRKTDTQHAWRFCLSFFCTLEWMNFWKFALEKDPYLYFWVLSFLPLLDYNDTYNEFLEANSWWADFWDFKKIIWEKRKNIQYSNKGLKPLVQDEGHSLPMALSPLVESCRTFFSLLLNTLFNVLNTLCQKLFLPKTLKHYEKIWKPYGIIITDHMLKFHNWDIRKKISKMF